MVIQDACAVLGTGANADASAADPDDVIYHMRMAMVAHSRITEGLEAEVACLKQRIDSRQSTREHVTEDDTPFVFSLTDRDTYDLDTAVVDVEKDLSVLEGLSPTYSEREVVAFRLTPPPDLPVSEGLSPPYSEREVRASRATPASEGFPLTYSERENQSCGPPSSQTRVSTRSAVVSAVIYKEKRKDHHNILEKFVASPMFETVFASAIVLNSCVMAAECQYAGLSTGVKLSMESAGYAADWPGAASFFDVSFWCFGLIFLTEVVLKVCAQRNNFFRKAWNYIDTAIVVQFIVDAAGADLGINTQFARVLRLVRVGRLMRLVKTVQAFDSLFLLVTALRGSVKILLWTILLLLSVQTFAAFLINQLLVLFYFDDRAHPLNERQGIYKLFGTFTRSLFSLFEMALGNWPTISRALAENVTEWFMLFTVLHKLTIGFAVLGVVNSVFIQETLKVAAIDDRLMVRQKQRAMRTHRAKMQTLFKHTDTDGDGNMDLTEFRQVFAVPEIRTWLSSMELDSVGDVDKLFTLLDNGDGLVTQAELIDGVAKLKGAARSIDLIYLTQELEALRCELNQHPSRHLRSRRYDGDEVKLKDHEVISDGAPPSITVV